VSEDDVRRLREAWAKRAAEKETRGGVA
jgi:hypothetical protein